MLGCFEHGLRESSLSARNDEMGERREVLVLGDDRVGRGDCGVSLRGT